MRVKPTRGLSEAEGRAVLREAFTAAGFEIEEDYPLTQEGVAVTLDGWDPKRRVGYEYLTRESGDRRDFTDPEIGKLYNLMGRGELKVLLIDGEGKPDKEMLQYLAKNFLHAIVEDDPTRAEKTRAERRPDRR